MRRLVSFLLAVFLLIVLCSCELSYQAPAVGKIRILVYGNDYSYTVYNPIKKEYEHPIRYLDGTYTNYSLSPLSGTVNDATEVGKAISALAEKTGYENSIVYRLTEYDRIDIESFENTINEIAADSNNNDLTIIFFSCHGAYLDEKGNKVPLGTKIPYGTDETANTYLIFRSNSDNYNVLYPVSDVLSRIKIINGTKVIIGDFCHSGSLVQPDYFSVTFGEYIGMDAATLFSVYRDEISIDPSLYCLSAARYYEESNEPSNGGHGYFTAALLEGLGWDENKQTLTTPKAGKDGKISLFELAKYVTTHDSEPSGKSQTPMVSGGSNDIVLFSF